MNRNEIAEHFFQIGLPLIGAAIKSNQYENFSKILSLVVTDKTTISLEEILKQTKSNDEVFSKMKSFESDFKNNILKYIFDTTDVKDSRNTKHKFTFGIAFFILFSFVVSMIFVLYGSWLLLSGTSLTQDPAAIAAVSGLVGAIVGYLSQNASTVVNYIFGSSHSSVEKTDMLKDMKAPD